MISKFWRLASLVLLLLTAGCADLAALLSTPTAAPLIEATPSLPPAATVTAPLPVSPEPRKLRIWLPPNFDPNADTTAARLLRQRLAEFQASQRALTIEIRIKAVQGRNGLLNSLAVTSAAAPSALPDLIALPRVDLEVAASRGLLRPIDGLSTLLDDPNWYPFARELGHVQNIGYGLPFAGDALVLVHRPTLKIQEWPDVFTSRERLGFPGDSSRLLALLSIYVSAGGKLVNEQGQPGLEAQSLTRTLNLFKDGLQSGTLTPESLTEPEPVPPIQVEQSGLRLQWAVNNWDPDRTVMQPIPGLGASPHVFGNGWLWALAGSTSENQQVATELAEFLLEDDFLSGWTEASGYLPTRVTLAASQNVEVAAVLEAAQVLPSDEVVAALGPILHQAAIRVLHGESVEVVVQNVMEQMQ